MRVRVGRRKGCGADGVTGLEQGGDAGMVLQDRPQPVREHGGGKPLQLISAEHWLQTMLTWR
jgi:hypothetical protein